MSWVGELCQGWKGSPIGNRGSMRPCRITHIFPGCSMTRRTARKDCAPGVVRDLSHARMMVLAERNGDVTLSIEKASYFSFVAGSLNNQFTHSISGERSPTV